jgi:hypothetical protein
MAAGNSGDTIVSQTAFYGGKGTDRKIGIKNSFGDAECLDARKNPSQLTVLPGSRKLNDADLRSLIVAMTQTPDGVRWGIAKDGKLYKIDNDNDITLAATLPNWENGTFGDLAYWRLTDILYITGIDRVYAYTNATRNEPSEVKTVTAAASKYPTVAKILVKNRLDKWIGGTVDRWSFKNGMNGSYQLQTSLQETDAHTCIFLPDQSPMVRIGVKFLAKGNGTVTLTVHDPQHRVIATKTIDASQVTTTGLTYFDFDQTRLGEVKNFGTEYHMHLYASGGGFSVETYETGQLYGLHFKYYAALLENTRRKAHPIINWLGSKLIIGNGQYIADWSPSGLDEIDESEFDRHRAIVETGMEITSLTSNDEYVVAGCEKVSSTPGRVFQEGMIGFWDGYADALNFKIDTPMGEPKSLYTYQNITYAVIDGAIYAYTGGKQLIKIRTLEDSQSEYTNTRDATDVYPKCMAVRRGILLLAYPSVTTLKTMRHGIYSWGSIDKNYPNCFYYSYDIPEANGNYNTDEFKYEIGGVWNYGDTLYYSYTITNTRTNSVEHNMAIVDNNSKPAKKFKYESLKYDGGAPWTEKMAMRVGATFSKLPDGVKITPKYRIDDGDWVYGTYSTKQGDTEVKLEINKRFRELEFGFDGEMTDDNTVTPRIISVQANVRSLGEERKL